MAKKEEYLQALEKIMNTYDAYCYENKYGGCTHKKEFWLLTHLKGEYVLNALGWLQLVYDCSWADEFRKEEGTAYTYLKRIIEEEA